MWELMILLLVLLLEGEMDQLWLVVIIIIIMMEVRIEDSNNIIVVFNGTKNQHLAPLLFTQQHKQLQGILTKCHSNNNNPLKKIY